MGGWSTFELTRLSHITMKVAVFGIITEELLQSLLGVWAFVLSFRRCLFSLFERVYLECAPVGLDRHAPFKLSWRARDELALAAVLVPCTLVDLRTPI